MTSLVNGTCLSSWIETSVTGQEIFYRLGGSPEVSLGTGSSCAVARMGNGSGAILWNENGLFRFSVVDELSQGPTLELHDFGFTPDDWAASVLLDGSLHLVAVSGMVVHFIHADLKTGVVNHVGSQRQSGAAITDLNLDSVAEGSWKATWIQGGSIRLASMAATILTTEDTGIEAEDHSMSLDVACLLYTSPSPRDATLSRMPSSA